MSAQAILTLVDALLLPWGGGVVTCGFSTIHWKMLAWQSGKW